MFIQRVFCGWASASVTKDRHAGGFTWPPLSRNSSPAKTSLSLLFVWLRGLPLTPSPRALLGSDNRSGGILMKCQHDYVHFTLLFPLGREELSVAKTLPSRNRLIPHPHPPNLPGAARLLLTFGLYLPQFSHVEKQTQNLLSQTRQSLCGHCGEQRKRSRRAFLRLMEVCLRKDNVLV